MKIVKWYGASDIGKVIRTVFSVESNTSSGLAKAIAGPNGRFYVGTYNASLCGGPANYSFYRYTSKKKYAKRLFGNLHTTTGIAIDKKAKKLFQVDGCLGIAEFDWDSKTGNICKSITIL